MRTRSQSRAEETRTQARPGAPVCVELHDVLTHIFSHVGDHHGGNSLTRCEAVCQGWRECSKDPLLEPTWRQLCLRMSPAAPIAATDDEDSDSYVCTAFTNPTVTGVLATCARPWTYKLSFRLLFQRRMRAATSAEAARRVLGRTCPDWSLEVPLYCCTTKALVPSSFKYEDLSFTFELYQNDGERRRRISYMEDWNEDQDEDENETVEYEDYLSPTVLSNYAAPPHYVNPDAKFKENLVWCSTVRGEPRGVCAQAPRAAEPGGTNRIARRTSVGIDTLMDDQFSEWCEAYRMVVTATRDTDGKMCQIVDVVGRDRRGFKELDGDSMTGYRTFMVVPDEDDDVSDDESEDARDNDDPGLSAWCFFGSNQYDTRIEQQLEEPGRDEKVDKAWDGMINSCQSPGALFELSISWNNDSKLQIAKALGTLEWY